MGKKRNRTNWIIGLVCSSPVILLIESLSFSEIMSLIRDKSDIAVIIGLVSACVLILLNILLVKLIINKTKKA